MNYYQFLLLTTMLMLCCVACERVIPADQYFCMAEEVYVLEEPFKEETAIILMYKGDDVFLLGDTVYLELPPIEGQDSVAIDSSQYYVKVKAKRGVIGWVNAQELQHERPKAVVVKPAAPVKIPPKVDAIPSPLAILDSLLLQPDSLKKELLAAYISTQDSSNTHRFQLLKMDSTAWSFQWQLSGQCDTLLKGQGRLKGRVLHWEAADSCQYRFEWLSKKEIKISVDSSCLNRICLPKGKLFKLDRIQKGRENELESSTQDSTSKKVEG